MVNRFWDKNNRYSQGFLKEYRHWVLEVSYRQHTLGSFIIFSKRRVEKISELNIEELGDLASVMREIEKTLSKIPTFMPDRFNYWQMGNSLHHLHFHGIPRYKTSKIFNGVEWTDETWGHPPIWSALDCDEKLVIDLSEAIKPHLPI